MPSALSANSSPSANYDIFNLHLNVLADYRDFVRFSLAFRAPSTPTVDQLIPRHGVS